MTTHVRFCLLAVALLLTACDNPLIALPDDIESFVRGENVGQLRHGRRVAILPADDVHVYTVKYGEPQDCPSGCFYLGGLVLKHDGRIGWLRLDAVELVYDPERRAPRPAAGAHTYFPLRPGDDALFSDRVVDAVRSADAHAFVAYLTFMLLEDSAPENGLYRLSERLPQDGWPALVWLFLTHPAVQCSERVLWRIAELHGFQRDYSRERAEARELLDSFAERCSQG